MYQLCYLSITIASPFAGTRKTVDVCFGKTCSLELQVESKTKGIYIGKWKVRQYRYTKTF